MLQREYLICWSTHIKFSCLQSQENLGNFSKEINKILSNFEIVQVITIGLSTIQLIKK